MNQSELVEARTGWMKEMKESRRLEQACTTLERAIYVKCYECSGGVKVEIERCHIDKCALHPYRLDGK